MVRIMGRLRTGADAAKVRRAGTGGVVRDRTKASRRPVRGGTGSAGGSFRTLVERILQGELKCRSIKVKMKPEDHPIRCFAAHGIVARCTLRTQR